MRRPALALALVLFGLPSKADDRLDPRLGSGDPATLAAEAKASGDPSRGALLFFQPYLACAKCHDSGTEGNPLGPDLAKVDRSTAASALAESVLEPSKSIRKGYEPVTVATVDGRAIAGILAEDRPEALVIRDASRDGVAVTVPKAEIDQRKDGGPSLMPSGLVNQLATRQELLDLLSYVIEVAERGPARASALRPSASALAPPPLPPYEAEVDHAGMIAGLGRASYRRGEAIYLRVCANCHGAADRPGSLPNSLRFASGAFKNGNDPFRMYQTLTRGFGAMPPQAWMVPEQKYDVIHYVREAYLKPLNPKQYVSIDKSYLERLPKGTTRGPEPSAIEPWAAMDYGPSLMATLEVSRDGSNIANKGIAIRLDPGPGGVSRGRAWVVFEHDAMRVAAAWSGTEFIDWNGINFNGRHEVHPSIVGEVAFTNPDAPGWADPETGTFDDPRLKGRDGRPYGPLPKSWARYRGLYHSGDRVVVAYDVGKTEIRETFGLAAPVSSEPPVFTRAVEVGKSPRDLWMRVAPSKSTSVNMKGGEGAELVDRDGFWLTRVRAAKTPLKFRLMVSKTSVQQDKAPPTPPPVEIASLTTGGPRRWTEILKTRFTPGDENGPFASDVLEQPNANPWNCLMRFGGLDFLPGGKELAVCTWDGDVWRVGGLDDPSGVLTWRRIASGLFQPLGLKVVDGSIHVTCRDQIAILRDLNGDGETDFYECFNSDHQVTEHFHEFAMDLQTDASGNFYYAKAARHGKTALVPQHGTLLKVARDGSSTEILANGFRAPNGVCVNADGSFFMTDQEGFWLPKNRINRVVKGGFYGNMWGFTDVKDPSDSAMAPPICWITNAFDRSPGEVVRVEGRAWGPLEGSHLNLSYGMGQVFIIPHEEVGNVPQGGMCALPGVSFPTGVMRGRFHPADASLYLAGLFAWAGNREQPGGLYRLRPTGKPSFAPIGLKARKGALTVTFSDPLDRAVASDVSRYEISTWSLKRSQQYGSKHYDEKTLAISSARVSEDGRVVTLSIPELGPTWCYELAYALKGAKGEPVQARVDGTVNAVRD